MSLWPITDNERRSEVVKDQMKRFKVELRVHVANDGPLRGVNALPEANEEDEIGDKIRGQYPTLGAICRQTNR